MSQNKPPRFGGSIQTIRETSDFAISGKKITHQKGKWSRRLVNQSWKKNPVVALSICTHEKPQPKLSIVEISSTFKKYQCGILSGKIKTVQTHQSYQSDLYQVQQFIQSIFRPPHLQIEAANLSKLGFLWFVVRDFLFRYPDPLHSIF